ncbi:MAG: sodium:proton antiporter [Proteobacteria bacterium]|nr:sodium:proton antiporter [Pseudomonadota bacterium]MBU1641487.1 sodium:proton antiporter [Pseudomonadota bacterium]
MSFFEIIAILTSLAAVFGFLNARTVRLPTTIGIMIIALLFSLLFIAVGSSLPDVKDWGVQLLAGIDFNQALMHGMLGFLLFAGALHVNFDDLVGQYRVIGSLATVGVVVSTFLIGTVLWYILALTPAAMSYGYCLLFGALISPTDPIAVLSILKSAKAPKSLEVKITGESLFNDGVGVVIFLVILEIVSAGQQFSASHVGFLLIQEAGGGALFGLGIGYLAYRMLKEIDDYQVEVMITLALVTGGYVLAEWLHLSAPIAMVVAGLLIGNRGRKFAMSEKTRKDLDTFWELLDSVLNAILFTLLGLEIMILDFSLLNIALGLAAIVITLAGRLVSVAIPITILKRWRTFSPKVIRILTWGGLRGGISVALALSLPTSPERDLILIMTYTVVVFSIVVQGLSIGSLVASVVSSKKGTANQGS